MHKEIEEFNHILEKDLKEELQKVNSAGTIDPNEVKTITDAVKLMVKLKEYEAWCDGEMNGRSYGDYSYRRGRNPMNGQYVSRGHDYGRMSYNGPYESPMWGNGSRASYDMGYSGHSINDRMIARLEQMMDEADSDFERQKIQEAIGRMEMSK